MNLLFCVIILAVPESSFFVENCDNAGFFEVNKKFMLFHTGLTEEQLMEAGTELLRQGPVTTNAVPSMAPQTTSSPVNNMTPTTNATASINVENVEVIHKGTVEIRGLQETLNIASLSQSQLQELGTKIKSAMGSQFLATG